MKKTHQLIIVSCLSGMLFVLIIVIIVGLSMQKKNAGQATTQAVASNITEQTVTAASSETTTEAITTVTTAVTTRETTEITTEVIGNSLHVQEEEGLGECSDDFRYDDEEEYADGFFNKNGFYGVWCGAFLTEEEAQNFADNLSGQGYSSQVTLTTWWSKLNSDPYYVITYGAYDMQKDAEAALRQVQVVCPGAYVKFSGAYVGN